MDPELQMPPWMGGKGAQDTGNSQWVATVQLDWPQQLTWLLPPRERVQKILAKPRLDSQGPQAERLRHEPWLTPLSLRSPCLLPRSLLLPSALATGFALPGGGQAGSPGCGTLALCSGGAPAASALWEESAPWREQSFGQSVIITVNDSSVWASLPVSGPHCAWHCANT